VLTFEHARRPLLPGRVNRLLSEVGLKAGAGSVLRLSPPLRRKRLRASPASISGRGTTWQRFVYLPCRRTDPNPYA
jgi:hypothetical protein